MAKKQMLFKTKGMNQDLSVSAFNPEFSFENRNLRLSTNEGNTLLSWVNEKGTAKLKDSSNADIELVGIPIGTAVLNHRLIIFTTNNTNTQPDPLTTGNHDYIYVLEYADDAKTQMQFIQYNGHNYLYNGNLNLCTKHPLETLVSYEAENVQKVYWVDGRNQPRMVNLESTNILEALDTQFDFVPTLQLNESVKVEKLVGSAGMFAPGVIQYAFTYYNKHGHESNIFYTTPLYYVSPIDRGGRPDEKVDNAFRITVEDVDTNFEYLRIYSIQRTSLNATPFCKRIQDIYLKGLTPDEEGKVTASFLDTGTSGDTVDPTELLYKGGETITAETIEQKDGTLFLGNIKTVRNENIHFNTGCSVKDTDSKRTISPHVVSSSGYIYENQLFASQMNGNVGMSCAGFKCGDTYRCGVQFQHKSGKWSHPVWIADHKVKQRSSYSQNNHTVSLPRIQGELSQAVSEDIAALGYVKARAVVVFPTMQDRETICQGVINPTMSSRLLSYSQSSWFFRPQVRMTKTGDTINFPYARADGSVAPVSLQYYPGTSWDDPEEMWNQFIPHFVAGGQGVEPWETSKFPWGPDLPGSTASQTTMKFMRSLEVQGVYDTYNAYLINNNQWTVHSPDLEFNDEMYSTDFTSSVFRRVGDIKVNRTFSDILIETDSPTISGNASGFVHKSFNETGPYGIVAGLFYDDYLVDDQLGDDHHLGPYPKEQASGKWLVYPWQMNGSLNNDFNRPSDKGAQTSKLKKKVISNLRIASTTFNTREYTTSDWYIPMPDHSNLHYTPQLYSSDEAAILKIGGNIYHGNVDTMFSPDTAFANFLALDGLEWQVDQYGHYTYEHWEWTKNSTSFTSNNWLKTFSRSFTAQEGSSSLYKHYVDETTGEESWHDVNEDLGDDYVDIVLKKNGIRMKYKSSPHLVIDPNYNDRIFLNNEDWTLPIVEICKVATNLFGGQTKDAFRENIWIPCGEPVILGYDGDTKERTSDGKTVFFYDYGDTYFQRYDCLKTYPFTREDPNQIVEIGSFMLETHINIDGRYDRNRGQQSNINMTPQNFNLMNPVYSQVDNFFTYRIVDDEFYENTTYPNQITWSKTKNSGADVDLWTNITMASVLELDGDKGEVTSIKRLNDQLLCFQDSGISQILYNENVQVSTETGVPIEIANSGKVQGKRYLSNTVGCSNKWSMVNTPAGIYFIDSNDKSIYRLGEGLQNVSQQGGFNAWCKQHIPAGNVKWSANDFENFVAQYDKQNQDVLFINANTALAFSEKLNAFTSFYDYGHTPYLCNLDDTGVWISYFTPEGEQNSRISLWKHQAGNYCQFFGTNKPFSMTLVGNPEPQTDKIFTNLEFRANVDGEGFNPVKEENFEPFIPMDSLEVWNEHQHGVALLDIKNGHGAMQHNLSDGTASLNRKFRIWRCDIPRNNVPGSNDETTVSFEYIPDDELGITRYYRKPMDRMRNPWLYLKLQKKASYPKSYLRKTEIHDIVMTYFV